MNDNDGQALINGSIKPKSDSNSRRLHGAEATRRFIELLTCDEHATMKWFVSPTEDTERYLFATRSSFGGLARRLEKDQRAQRNISLEPRWQIVRGNGTQNYIACLESFYEDIYNEDDFPIKPDFVTLIDDEFWTAYWLLTHATTSDLKKLRDNLARHYEMAVSHILPPQPVPGYLWHTEYTDPTEVVLIDNTGKPLGDISHFEGLHTLSEMNAGLQIEKPLSHRKLNFPQSDEDRYEYAMADIEQADERENFPGFIDGESKSPSTANDLVSNFLPDDSLYMIYGNTSSFKTFAMIDLACSATIGTPLWHCKDESASDARFDIHEPLRVTFIAGEGQTDISNRIEAWKNYHGIQQELNLYIIVAMPNFKKVDDLNKIIKSVSDKLGYTDILIVDPLIEAAADYNISDPTSARQFMKQCKYLQRRLLCSICLIHHTGKDGKAHVGAQDLLATVDVADKFEVSRVKSVRKSIKVSNIKFRDRQTREPFWLEAVPISAKRSDDNEAINSIILTRLPRASGQSNSHNPADIEKYAIEILEERHGKKPLKAKELAEEIIRRHFTDALTDEKRTGEISLVRRILNSLASAELRRYARREGAGKTSPWLFECPS